VRPNSRGLRSARSGTRQGREVENYPARRLGVSPAPLRGGGQLQAYALAATLLLGPRRVPAGQLPRVRSVQTVRSTRARYRQPPEVLRGGRRSAAPPRRELLVMMPRAHWRNAARHAKCALEMRSLAALAIWHGLLSQAVRTLAAHISEVGGGRLQLSTSQALSIVAGSKSAGRAIRGSLRPDLPHMNEAEPAPHTAREIRAVVENGI